MHRVGADARGGEPGAPVVLAFDTAGSACSVAIARGGVVLAHERREMRHGHAEALLPMVDRVTIAARLAARDITIVAATVGPGGFTGIRAGLAAAHGLALATGARLLGVSSFAAVAAPIPPDETRLLVALDSRRADLYAQLFSPDGAIATEPAAVAPEQLSAWLGAGPVRIAGDAAQAAAAALHGRDGADIAADSTPDARGVVAALSRWPERADPAAAPLYLRAPDVSFPRPRAGSAG